MKKYYIFLPILILTIIWGLWYVSSFPSFKDMDKGQAIIPIKNPIKLPQETIHYIQKLAGFSVGDRADKIVLLSFWASWCSVCKKEFPAKLKLAESMQKNLLLITISVGTRKINTFIYHFLTISVLRIVIAIIEKHIKKLGSSLVKF